MLAFHYKRTRKQTARSIFISALVLPIWLVVFYVLGKDKVGFEVFSDVAIVIFTIADLVMVGYGVWLLKNPAAFEIRLGEQEFSVAHPLFEEWNFNIKPSEIVSIENTSDLNGYAQTLIKMTNGEQHRLCRNYRYSLKKLYKELTRINPSIDVPANPYHFPRRHNHPGRGN
ncbi:hypothetical protein BTA51_17730 [Hahella sp. CCB-MM4]|uniref:hypothetical protein n=1 Tax=Hahella sp. (strain CCB-MM4) TaxID=1926491 RepID=UPI000B9C4EC4|nr:hypothetical protein [Hahella sp. CCB-MM4]OZG72187.1 hypothetical protein BTA51_17730 [Hahella sp. CCB-MM4]